VRVVVTSVHYADFLAVTLPAWKAFVPAGLVVATCPGDDETVRVAGGHDVPVVVTDAWTRRDPAGHEGGDPTFNMGYGLNVALGLAGDLVPAPESGEIVGHVNPDCYPFGRWPADGRFGADGIYAFWRHECLSPKALAEHVRGVRPLERFPRLKNSKGAPIGYCQFFRAAPGRRFGSYPTAAKFDTHFTARFLHQEMLTEAYLLHLGPINVRENWAGRTVPAWGAA
jgi:hypothetical protein